MPIHHPALKDHVFLDGMRRDPYFPAPLVEKGAQILVELAEAIEREKPDDASLLALTHAATERFNDLQEAFWNAGSEIETAARECIAGDVRKILETFGYTVDIETAIAPRDW